MSGRTHDLFAYGTLIFDEIVQMVTGRCFPGPPAYVDGHARYRLDGEVYPALVEQPGSRVNGRLYLGLDDDALALLDRFEGDLYDRVEVRAVTDDGQTRPAATYRIKGDHAHRLTQDPWDPAVFDKEDRSRFIESYLGFRRI